MAVSEDLSRRQFVVLAASCAAACACGIACADTPTTPVDVGTLADYPQDGIFPKFIKSDRVIVYRENGQIYASTAICPHRGAVLSIRDDEVYCSKHGSTFDAAGSVVKGPAKDSLEHYAIALDDNKHLIVDRTKTFREKNWDDSASFVKVS
jgi:nitrite reductase/ring-hydroxylating ferredoxin subunit